MHKALYQGSLGVAALLLATGGSLDTTDHQVGCLCCLAAWFSSIHATFQLL